MENIVARESFAPSLIRLLVDISNVEKSEQSAWKLTWSSVRSWGEISEQVIRERSA